MAEKQKPTRTLLASGRKELKEIVDTCEAIAERKFNPFFMDVKLGLQTLRQYFPYWGHFEDHCLDAHAINRLSEVVRLQNTQLKFQSSALYADPEFIERKIEKMSEKGLAEVFLQSWHPITELEQLTGPALTEALEYWNILLPIEQRWKRRQYDAGKGPTKVDSDVLAGLGIHGEEFAKVLIALWNELRRIYASESKPVDYWKFVKGVSYQETVQRAYFASFLITYGYAKLHGERSDLALSPLDPPVEKPVTGGFSFPIAIPMQAE